MISYDIVIYLIERWDLGNKLQNPMNTKKIPRFKFINSLINKMQDSSYSFPYRKVLHQGPRHSTFNVLFLPIFTVIHASHFQQNNRPWSFFETESQIIIFTGLKLITLLRNFLKNYGSFLDSQNCVANNDSEKFRDKVQRIYLTVLSQNKILQNERWK